MTYKEIETRIGRICEQHKLSSNLFAGSYSECFPAKRIDVDMQSDNGRKRLAHASFMTKYIEEDDRYVVWENRPGRLTFYISKKDYLSAMDCETGFVLKGKGYKAWGEERVWVLSPEQLAQCIADLATKGK